MIEVHPQPPRMGRLLVRLCRLGTLREDVESDLLALFELRCAQRGRAFANRRYVADALSLWSWHPADSIPAPQHRYGGVRAMKQDIIFAARLFRRQPGLFGLTVIGLGVAIGISTAVFSIVRAVAFGGYGVSAPEAVFRVALPDGPFSRPTGAIYQGNWAFSDYLRLRDVVTSAAVVASVPTAADFRATADPVEPLSARVLAVSGTYFPVLGFRTTLGRSLTAADDMPGMPRVVVSQGFWKNQLGGDPAIVGRTLWLDDRPFAVIGVADRSHSSPPYAIAPDLWTTLATHAEMSAGQSQSERAEARARLAALKSRDNLDAAERDRLKAIEADLQSARPSNPAVDVLGRVAPGVTRAQAEAEVRSIAAALANERPGATPRRPPVQFQSLDEVTNAAAIRFATILMITAGVVMLLACANVTNLLLASAAGRRREIGTRLAIGASRGRIVRQLLTESLMLGVIGGALGLWFAIEILPSFAAMIRIPPAVDVSPDLSVYAFVGLVTLAVGVIAGLAPARYGRRGDVLSALKADQQASPAPLPRGWLRSLLVGGQATASIVFLVLATLLTRALVQTGAFDLGYDASRLVTVSVRTVGSWGGARQTAYWSAALERVRQLPGVAGASLALVSPFAGTMAPQRMHGRLFSRNETSPEFFSTLGVRMIRGRSYTADEVRSQAPVAVISARLAQDFWGTADPIGSTLERVWGPDDADSARLPGLLRKPRGTRVVGVAADVITQLNDHDTPTIYLPLADSSAARMVISANNDPHAVARTVRDALEALDPSVRARASFPLDGLERDRERPKVLATLAVMVGATALGLAIVGLFGVTAFSVEQRRYEVSVRRALGASNAQLMRMLFGESLRPVAVGLTCGLVLSVLGGRAIQSLLYGVSSRDPLAIVAAIAILLGTAGAAVFFPARRATRVDPAQLLKMG
jgi:predicted permease